MDTITYIKSLEIEQNKTDDLNLKWPADISQLAKERGLTVPWQKALFSNVGVAVSVSMFVNGTVIATIIIILWRPWSKKTKD